MRRARLALTLCLGILPQAGCLKDFDPASFIDKLRLLTVVADQPERASGESAMLTAYFANPGKPDPTVTWAICLEPPSPSSGGLINPDCASDDMGAPLAPLGTGATTTVKMPPIPAVLASFADSTNGSFLPIRLVLTEGNQRLTAFYRLRWHDPFAMNLENSNPQLDGIFQEPQVDAGADQLMRIDSGSAANPNTPPATPPEVHANEKFYMRASVSGAETYNQYDDYPPTDMNMSKPRSVTEILSVNWYTTAGTFDHDVTGMEKPDTTLTLDKHLPPSGTPIDIWTVALDGRGGTAILHATLMFR